MIRFCDREVYTVSMDTVNRQELLSFFWREHAQDIVAVYTSENEFYGTLCYTDVLACENLEDVVCTEKVHWNENLFEEAHPVFDRLKEEGKTDIFLPVVNEAGELLTFCYDENNDDGMYIYCERMLKVLEESREEENVLKHVNVRLEALCIIDFNELAYHLYQTFHKIGVPVHVIGSGWSVLKENVSVPLDSFPDYAWLRIYSEGTDAFIKKKEYDKDTVQIQFTCLQPIFAYYGAKTVFPKLIAKEMERCLQSGIENMVWLSIPQVSYEYLNNLNYMVREYTQQAETVPLLLRKEIYGEETVLFYENSGKDYDDSLDELVVGNDRGLNAFRFCGESGKRKLWLIGPCIAAGIKVLAKDSLAYYLQEQIRRYDYEVVRMVVPNWKIVVANNFTEHLPIREQDIVVFAFNWPYSKEDCCSKVKYLDASPVFERNVGSENLFFDCPAHTNARGNQLLAGFLLEDYLEKKIQEQVKKKKNQYLQKGDIIRNTMKAEIRSYLDKIYKPDGSEKMEKIGAIVMNANPFTNGHQYLVGQASEKVDFLYLFVVEEDKSEFGFQDRYALVKQGTKHLNNVCVVPSGKFILSFATLPLYFGKSENKEAKMDASYDVQIFARYIAPELGITVRFAGEEPIDMVTRQYNEQMAELLPEFGIEFCVIPRKEQGGTVISASRVRSLLKEKKWDEIEQIVPVSTFLFLKENYS